MIFSRPKRLILPTSTYETECGPAFRSILKDDGDVIDKYDSVEDIVGLLDVGGRRRADDD